jgi:hypothetical protein
MRPVTFARLGRFAGPAVVLFAAAVAVAPQLLRGNSCGHDFDFHLVSWLDAQSGWRLGIPYPHWTPSANFNAGEPRFVFYPPLTWMLGAALGFVLPWQLVPAALTFLLLAATGLATRALARQALSGGAATLAGCAAIFSGYALFCAYERSAFGELTGGLWIPLLLLLILSDRDPARSTWHRALDGSTAPLALVVAGAWLSNAPVGVMACYLLAAVAVTAALLSKSWAPVLRAAIAAPLGMGLASGFLLPAVWEQPWADLKLAASEPGEMIENSWLFGRHADPALDFHDFVLHQASIIAVVMVAVALGGLLLCYWRGSLTEGALKGRGFSRATKVAIVSPALAAEGMQTVKSAFPRRLKPLIESSYRVARLKLRPFKTEPIPRRWWLPLALIPLAVLFLQLPISLPVWNLLPKLRFLQFPWRWLVVLEAPMAVFFASAVWPAASARRWQRVAVAAACAAVFLAVTATAGWVFFQPCDEDDAVAGMLARYRSGAGMGGTDEYEPPGADDSLLASGLPGACLVSDPATLLGKGSGEPDTAPVWDAAQGSCDETFEAAPARAKNHAEHFEILASASHPGYLILRLRSYPAWRVEVNGRPVAGLPQRDDGLMAVPVPKGPVDLTADWTVTPDVIAGRWLSGLALLLIAALWWLERRLQSPGPSHLS